MHSVSVKGAVCIAAPASGSGKTLVTCALIRALRERGLTVQPFKAGPDYIDPLFHDKTAPEGGLHKCENLDTFLADHDTVRSIYEECSEGADISVIEGVMWLYDGVGGIQEKGSTYDLAVCLGAPIILVTGAGGASRSILAVIRGFLDYDREGLIKSYQIGNPGIQIIAPVGGAYGTLFCTTYQRDGSGNIIVDENGLPKVSTTSRELGHFTPNWTGGISNTFRYKDFTLSFLIDASIGGKIYSNTNRTGRYTGVLASTLPGRDADHGGVWYYKNAQGDNVGIPTPDYTTSADGLYHAVVNGVDTRVYQDGIIVDGVNEKGEKNNVITSAEKYYHRVYSIAEANIWDASYIKLREVALTYNLPHAILSKLHLTDASVSLTGRNLWIIHKNLPNVDPEAAHSTGNAQGYESLSLPTTRSLGISLNLKF
jgi:hypothetical protein